MDVRIQKLPFDPAFSNGLPEKLLRSHHRNNCGAALEVAGCRLEPKGVSS